MKQENNGNDLPPKKKRNIVLEIVLALLICCVIVAALSGAFVALWNCSPVEDDIQESGYFRYITVDESATDDPNELVVAIVGFTDEGQKQEAIDIPREIDGMPVKYIGYVDSGPIVLMGVPYYRLENSSLKKLYIHDNIDTIVTEAFFDMHDIEIMMCSNTNSVIFDGLKPTDKVYVYKTLYESEGLSESERYRPANIAFMNNYSDEVNGGYYRLDNIGEGETILEPPAPEREGYEFGGWYTEPECVTAWDFESDTLPEEQTTTNENGEKETVYQETILYAKWTAA